MQLFKVLLMILSAGIVGLAAWMYFTRNPDCVDQPWWLVLVLGLLNLALIVFLFIRKSGHQNAYEEE